MAAKLARYESKRNPESDWDCYTSATEYFAAGVELLLYDTRIGTNHLGTTREQLQSFDFNLYCLAARYYENNNLWRPCYNGPNHTTATYNFTACRTALEGLGVTAFGPEGDGMKNESDRALNVNSGTVAPKPHSNPSMIAYA